jgi:hypothetical protein
MPNEILVFSETRKGWIAPRKEPIRVVSGKLRRKEGDEALIEIGPGWIREGRRVKAVFYFPPERRRVRVEKSKGGTGKTHWWLVDMEDGKLP